MSRVLLAGHQLHGINSAAQSTAEELLLSLRTEMEYRMFLLGQHGKTHPSVQRYALSAASRPNSSIRCRGSGSATCLSTQAQASNNILATLRSSIPAASLRSRRTLALERPVI